MEKQAGKQPWTTRTRNTARQQRSFVPSATASAEAVREVLTNHHGPAPWIDTVAEAVKHAVQNGYDQLRLAGGVAGNNQPGDPYRHNARSREELLATQHLVANSRVVAPTEPELDPSADLEEPKAPPNGDRTKQRNDPGPVRWVL